jgi:predicted aspartyl protease
MASRVALVVLVLVALGPIDTARAELYRWTDADGIGHYTSDPESIPPSVRGSVKVSLPPRAPDASADAAVRATTQPPAQTVIPFSPGGPIIVSGALNGQAVRLLVDTGADRTIISPAALLRAGLGDLMGAPVQVIGVGGRITATEVVVPALDIAGTRLGNFTIIVHDSSVSNADGLLGRDVLDAFTLTVDAAQGRAIIVPR